MRFEVPQFLGVEDKLFGPFSFRQAVYLAGGGAIIYLLFKFLPPYIAVILGIPVGAFALALTFYRPNGQPFMKMVGSVFSYMTNKKFYLWQNPQKRYIEEAAKEKADKKMLDNTKNDNINREPNLRDVARGLDMVDKIPK